MLDIKPYIRTCRGETVKNNINAAADTINGVKAVYVSAKADCPLDMEFGAGLDIEQPAGLTECMAVYRHSEYWCSPSFGKSFSEVPDETQGLIWKEDNGLYGVILPVVSEEYKCVLSGGKNGLTAKLFSWYDKLNECNALAFVYAEGENPYKLLERCAETAVRLLNNGCKTRAGRRYPDIFEYLGWCSWDAFQIRVTEDDLINKCMEFKEKNIPVRWAVIDDMWGDVPAFKNAEYNNFSEMLKVMHSSSLNSFKADPERFPNGLAHCITEMNRLGITVGMWHPTTGYWKGISEDGEIYNKYRDLLMKTDSGIYIHSFEQEKAYMYYSIFHDYLKECGAEFVKIDNQSMTRRFYKGKGAVGKIARGVHKAMEASVGEHFDNRMINCMGMASEDMWNRSQSPVSRCSDDFQPESRAWFSKHILQCSYNSLIQGQLYYCDWDMWWTDDGQAMKNSILRAISGGPVYVSDMLNRSRREVLMPLVLDDGRILRCDRPGMPSADCLTENPLNRGKIFKLQNICGECGVIAAFNLDESNKEASGTVSPSDADGIDGEYFAVYEHFSREMKILGKNECMEIKLKDESDYKLYIVAPLKNGFAAIGRTDKFISPKTIKRVCGEKIELTENGEYAYVKDGRLVITE